MRYKQDIKQEQRVTHDFVRVPNKFYIKSEGKFVECDAENLKVLVEVINGEESDRLSVKYCVGAVPVDEDNIYVKDETLLRIAPRCKSDVNFTIHNCEHQSMNFNLIWEGNRIVADNWRVTVKKGVFSETDKVPDGWPFSASIHRTHTFECNAYIWHDYHDLENAKFFERAECDGCDPCRADYFRLSVPQRIELRRRMDELKKYLTDNGIWMLYDSEGGNVMFCKKPELPKGYKCSVDDCHNDGGYDVPDEVLFDPHFYMNEMNYDYRIRVDYEGDEEV